MQKSERNGRAGGEIFELVVPDDEHEYRNNGRRKAAWGAGWRAKKAPLMPGMMDDGKRKGAPAALAARSLIIRPGGKSTVYTGFYWQ